ncbi:MAG: Mth938-like domain-containing protein [Alphaproteobacteria bacterium]|nr:Mth938-like domain-containing protein [Alphaproteobacteria bacterium]
MELTPLVPAGRQVIERYGASGFRVTGVIYRGSVLVFPDRTVSWSATSVTGVTWESLAPIIEDGGVQILLLGLGRAMGAIPQALRKTLHAAGIVLEPMDTGAACRTYNVLAAEDRHVAAALLPLS